MNAKILECTFEEYLKDPCEIPSLNQSTANILLQKSPAHAYSAHPRLGAIGKRATKEMDNGTLIHKFLLGEGHEIVIAKFDDWRTAAAREIRDTARIKGMTPILERQWDEAYVAVDRIKRQLALLDIDLSRGKNEFKIEFESDGVLCRRALDCWQQDRLTIYELKTIFCAHPETCATVSLRMGYDVEYSASIDAIQCLYPEAAGRIDFVFIFCETIEPFGIYACRPDGVFSHLGDMKWKKAKQIWKDCQQRNEWPGYGETIGSLTAPLWAIREELEEYEF